VHKHTRVAGLNKTHRAERFREYTKMRFHIESREIFAECRRPPQLYLLLGASCEGGFDLLSRLLNSEFYFTAAQ
jgi:hypothetical protein